MSLHVPRPSLDREEVAFLHRHYRRSRDAGCLERLLAAYGGLVRAVAARFSPGSGACAADLVQVGSLGLLAAIERYDPNHGAAFSTFAVPTIRGEIMRWLRDHTWEIKPPRHLRDRSLRLQRLQLQMAGELGALPTSTELAATIPASPAEIEHALELGLLRRGYSLDELASVEEGGGDAVRACYADDARLKAVETRMALDAALRELPVRERTILEARFFGERTQAEVAHALGISQFHVSRLERRALAKMRSLLA